MPATTFESVDRQAPGLARLLSKLAEWYGWQPDTLITAFLCADDSPDDDITILHRAVHQRLEACPNLTEDIKLR